MSAAFPHQTPSKQSALTGLGELDTQRQSGWTKQLTSARGVMTALFDTLRGVSGSTERVGWVGRLTAIATLLAALLGIPPGVSRLSELLWPYQLEISVGKDLEISYLPKRELVNFVFNVKAEEFGSKPNQIVSARAWIEQALTPKVLLNTSQPAFEENETRKYQPVIPAGPSPKNMQCSISFRLDDRSREMFQSVGLRRLVVEFKGKDHQMHQVPFCFNVEDEGIDRLFNSPEKQFRYINEDPMCPNDKP